MVKSLPQSWPSTFPSLPGRPGKFSDRIFSVPVIVCFHKKEEGGTSQQQTRWSHLYLSVSIIVTKSWTRGGISNPNIEEDGCC